MLADFLAVLCRLFSRICFPGLVPAELSVCSSSNSIQCMKPFFGGSSLLVKLPGPQQVLLIRTTVVTPVEQQQIMHYGFSLLGLPFFQVPAVTASCLVRSQGLLPRQCDALVWLTHYHTYALIPPTADDFLRNRHRGSCFCWMPVGSSCINSFRSNIMSTYDSSASEITSGTSWWT